MKALAAGQEIRVRPKGVRLYPHFSGEDEITLAPADPDTLKAGDIVFVLRKNNPVLRKVARRTDKELLLASPGFDDEEEPLPLHLLLGRVVAIAKEYARRDPVDPAICYDLLSAGRPPSEAWGDFGTATFEFRARYDYWEFLLCPLPGYRASDLFGLTWYDSAAFEQPDFCYSHEQVAAFRRCFVRTGRYGASGDRFVASYMPEEDVLRIIRECISEYDALRGEEAERESDFETS